MAMVNDYINNTQVFLCPSETSHHTWRTFTTSYGWNCQAGGSDASTVRTVTFTKPSWTYMFQDQQSACAKSKRACTCGCGGLTALQSRMKRGVRHNERANAAFFDGHVESVNAYDVEPDWGGTQNTHYLARP
jgi:prepilin-type processing-associated H-X9-DG protein